MATPEASVIIRTFNEEKHLPRLLDAMRGQAYRDFETVLVDSGSVDRTREIAAPFADKLLQINSHDFTFGYSLNVGIEAASGQFAVIISAHTLPTDENWLEALVRPLSEELTAMSYGRQLGWQNFSESQDLGRIFGARRRVLRPPNFFAHNGNSAIRKDLWQEHPFDETLPGLEDIEWAKYWMLRGYQVVYEPEAALYHIHDENWRQVRRRYYREAVAARWIGIKGRRHALVDSAKELGFTFLDLGKALWQSGFNAETQEKTRASRREIVLFRTNKAVGNFRGLLDGKTMQDPVSRQDMFFDRRGQAVVIHGQGRVSLEDVQIPEVKPGEVLIRTSYSGVCGIDLEMLDGTLGTHRNGTVKYPIVPGHELSGRVVATGPNVSLVKEGDAVVVENILSCGKCTECLRSNWMLCPDRDELGVQGRDGGYSQYVVVPGRFVHRLPPGLDLCKAALCQPLAAILKGLNRLSASWAAEPKIKRCGVVGAGSQGHMCARVLAARGHSVTAFDRDPLRRSYFEGTNIEVSDDLNRLGQFDALVEMTGDPAVLEAMLDNSAPGATILLLGLPYARRQFTLASVAAYDKTIVGSVGCSSQEFEEALKLLPELDVAVHLQCILPLDQFREGWEIVRQRKHLKVLLAVDGELA